MTPNLIWFLTGTWLLISFGGLAALIWWIHTYQLKDISKSSKVIFEEGEVGRVEDPSAFDETSLAKKASAETSGDHPGLELRKEADVSCKTPVLWLFGSATFWLIFGSLMGLVASLKFNFPDWLVSEPQLTFGRIRPIHLNSVIYGWLSQAGMGVSLWLLPRTLRTPLRGGRVALWGTHLWNIGMVLGLWALFQGWTDGLEWLEFPWQIDIIFVVAGAMIGVPTLLTLKERNVKHIYVCTCLASIPLQMRELGLGERPCDNRNEILASLATG